MNRNPTATFWLFAYGGITPGTHCATVSELLDWGPNIDHRVMRDDALIDRSRSKVGTRFLETERSEAGDVLLMVDHDISWRLGDLSHIARRALENNAVVGGVYSKRAFGQGQAITLEPDYPEFTMGDDVMLPATRLSTGFMAIPRTVLAAVAQDMAKTNQGFYPLFLPFVDADGEYLSEDWAFCRRAQNAGFRLLASPYPTLEHEGTYNYRVQDAMVEIPATRRVEVTHG